MLVLFLILLGLFQQIYSIEQSFKCLIKQRNTKIIFANLTFKCYYSRIYNTGCLKAISTDTIVLSYPNTEFTNLGRFAGTFNSFERSILTTEYIVMKIKHKNHLKKYQSKIEHLNSQHKVFHLGIPILMNPNTFINNFVLTNKLIHERLTSKGMTSIDISENKLDNIAVNYLLPLTYEVTKAGITGFRIKSTEYELVFCKELLQNKEELKKGNDENFSFGKLFRRIMGINEQISEEEQKYNDYEKFVNVRSLEIITLPKQHGPILFVDRIDPTKKSVMKLLRKGNGNINIFPSFDGHFYLTMTDNMWFGIDYWPCDEPEDENMIRGSNNRLMSNFALKRINNKGEEIRMFK